MMHDVRLFGTPEAKCLDKMKSLNDVLAEKGIPLPDITLDANMELPCFGEATHVLADILYRSWKYHYSGYHDDMMTWDNPSLRQNFYLQLEQSVKIGALLYAFHTEPAFREGRVYDIGCGVSIPSFSYSMFGGKEITAVDNCDIDIGVTKRFAELLHCSGIHLVCADAREVIEQGLGPQDILLFNKPSDPLDDYFLTNIGDKIPNAVLNYNFNREVPYVTQTFIPGLNALLDRQDLKVLSFIGSPPISNMFVIESVRSDEQARNDGPENSRS